MSEIGSGGVEQTLADIERALGAADQAGRKTRQREEP